MLKRTAPATLAQDVGRVNRHSLFLRYLHNGSIELEVCIVSYWEVKLLTMVSSGSGASSLA